MAIDETRLQNAIIKIDNKVTQLRRQLSKAEQMREALKHIRMKRIADIDENGNETNVRFVKPIDQKTQETISDTRRQEVYDKIVSKVEALP